MKIIRVLFTPIFALSITFSFYATAAVTDSEVKAGLSQLCPSCDAEALRLQLSNAREQLNDLGAFKIGRQQGFLPVTDSSIPEAVRDAAKSTLQIFIIAHDKSLAKKFPIKLLEDNLPSISASPDPSDKLIYKLASTYLAQCKKANLQECSIPGMPTGMIGGGTAFLVGPSGRELWTANHVFADAVREIMAVNGAKGISDLIKDHVRFEILLFDSSGNIVATPFDNSVRISYTATSTPMSADSTIPEVDSLQLELEKPLWPGLKIASNAPARGADVFHLGYPQCTGCSDSYVDAVQWLIRGTRFPFPDSNGNQLRVSVGSIIQTNPVLSSNADAAPGMSGGVCVNAEGEVVGINSRTSAEASSDRIQLVMRAVDIAPVNK